VEKEGEWVQDRRRERSIGNSQGFAPAEDTKRMAVSTWIKGIVLL